MWKPETPITYNGEQLDDRRAWIYCFAKEWEALEVDPEDLNFDALMRTLGPAIVDDYRCRDPVEVARQTFGTRAFDDWMPDLYPGSYADRKLTRLPRIQLDDVPF